MGSRRSTTRHPSSASSPLYSPYHFRPSLSTSSPLPPLNPSQPAPQSASPLNYHQLLLNPFQLVQKSVPQLDSQQFSPKPLRSHSQPAQHLASPLDFYQLPPQPLNPSPLAQGSPSPLDYQQLPLNPFYLAQKSVLQLDYQQFPPNLLSRPFYLAQKCAPTPRQVQNPALKCARPFLTGFKMRAACAPRCANFPKNPIFRVKNRLLPFSAPCVGSGDSDLFLLKKMAFSLPPDTMAPVAAHF